tara:strand:- start:1 stop:159 length:159 start_codon:yes stop_codon:yes gene_type:complete
MNIDKSKLRKSADIAKAKADEAKAAKNEPTVQSLLNKINELEVRLAALEAPK